MEKVRNSNFELMRIVSMFFIVLFHTIHHGNAINNSVNPVVDILLELIMFIVVIHVNSFVLVSGYFQSKSKFKLSKVIKLIFQVIFYCLMILLVAIKLGWIKDYNIVTFINSMNITSMHDYWFIKVYLVMYIFSDYLNKFIDRLERKEYKSFLLVAFIMLSIVPYLTGYRLVANDGFTIINFVFLYMIGGYLRKYPLKETYHFKNMSINGYRMLLLFSFFFLAIMNYLVYDFASEINGMSNIFSEISFRLTTSKYHYSTPFAILQSILYFEFFKTLNLKNSFINKISGCMFGIYLIHDNTYMRNNIYKAIKIDNGLVYGYRIIITVFVGSLIIFVASLIIEYIRKVICKKICNLKISKKIEDKLKQFVSSFNFNINW